MLFKKITNKGISLILITSMIGAGTFSYIPTVYASSNQRVDQENQALSTLSKLEIEGIALDQDFSSNINTYSASVENKINSVQILVEATIPNSSITINGQIVSNGSSGPLSLQTGENTFLITVDDGTNPPNTYTLTITRKKNENNLLQDIKFSKGVLSPKFNPSVIDYSVEVANEVESIIVTPEAAEKTSKIKINDSAAENNGVTVQLPVGKSDITIMVTAENGDQKTYMIHVTRAAKTNHTPSSSGTNNRPSSNPKTGTNTKPKISGNFNRNSSMQQNNGSSIQKTSTATLSSLTVSDGTWDSSFSKNEYTYHIALSSDVKTVTLSPTASYSSAVISIEGSSSKTISLTGKKTIISVIVTRGEDRKTYVLVFDKPGQQTDNTTATAQPSSDTSLTNTIATNNSTAPTVSGTNELNIKKNKTPKTFWKKIAAFFKKIF